jgi:intein/homing endonuclease
MAYVLGFFAADGSMIQNKRGAHFIEFNITDLELLEDIKGALRSDHKISGRVRSGHNWKTLYRLQIGSKEMFRDLGRFGFSQDKSKKMRLPEIPNKYLGDFVRGYFDGDGCVYFGTHWARDRKKKRYVFSTRFTSGSKSFLEDLKRSLSEYVHSGFIVEKKRKSGELSGYELVFSNRDSFSLFELMYKNGRAKLFLDRKYSIFNKAVNVLKHMQS